MQERGKEAPAPGATEFGRFWRTGNQRTEAPDQHPVHRMTSKQRAILAYIDARPDLSHRQIGQMIGRTRESVCRLISRARRAESGKLPAPINAGLTIRGRDDSRLG